MVRLIAGVFLGILGALYFVGADMDEYRDTWEVAWLKFVGGLCGFAAGCLLAG